MEIPNIAVFAAICFVLCAICTCLMFIKGKKIDGVVKYRSGIIYSTVMEIAIFAVIAILGLCSRDYKIIAIPFSALTVMSIFPIIVITGFRITYDNLGFEYKAFPKKPQRYSYSDITEIIEMGQNLRYSGMTIKIGNEKISVSESYLGGKEFMEAVKQRVSQYNAE